MLFSTTLYLALTVCILGTIYRIIRWFVVKVGPDAGRFATRQRVLRAFKSLLAVVFSPRIFRLIQTIFLRVILQGHILKKDPLRWLGHFSIFAGILLLVLFHALGALITVNLFPDYYSTANPFMFLRNFFGAIVLLGIVIAGCRRLAGKRLKKVTTGGDVLALVLLGIIIFSGFLLEASQIVSQPVFDEMVEQYADPEDSEASSALQSYWAEKYGVVFAGAPNSASPDLIAAGEAIHQESCAYCHARPTAAFVSYPISRMLRPVAVRANSIRLDLILWRVHFLFCFAMLAYLPFSKFRHLFTSSVSLMVRGLEECGALQPANRITRRVVSMDACMNCGQCSLHCSVEPIYRVLGNPNILPSCKMDGLKQNIRRNFAARPGVAEFNEGSWICTECYRCTQVCPAGINLQDLWLAAKDELASRGPSSPYRQVRTGVSFGQADSVTEPRSSTPGRSDSCLPDHSINAASFAACVQCGTCTNVCPVVADYQQDPQQMGRLDLTPQQIVNFCRLGITDRILNSKMTWDCFMCFKCQEHCPKMIPIAEMIYALRNRGYKELKHAELL